MSIWGVNQSPPAPVIATVGSDQACGAGAETNASGATVTVPTPGANFVLYSDVTFIIALGATAPGAMVIAARQGAGADYDTWTVPPVLLVNSANLVLHVRLAGTFGKNSLVAGATINITVNPTGQAVTVKQNSRVVHTFGQAPDA